MTGQRLSASAETASRLEELQSLAKSQGALRRVATLVANGAPPEEVFAAVTGEAGRLLDAHLAGMGRYDSDDTVTMLATWAAEGEHPWSRVRGRSKGAILPRRSGARAGPSG